MNAYQKDHTFYFPVRVFYEDTDAGGVVYHANYLKFGERARTEWLRHLDIGRERLQHEFDIMFVVRKATIDWRRPARLDDLLTVETRMGGAGRVRVTMLHTIKRGDTVLCNIEIEVVAVNSQFAPTQLPEALMKLLPPATHTIEEKIRERKE
jgi:acyl-CoA thioester hydrolase